MSSVTVRQCAILVGGPGTQLGSLPTPLLPCTDRAFLAWLMREFLRFGVEEFLLLTDHLSHEVEARIRELSTLLPRQVSMTISEAPICAGTGGALFHARERLAQRFLVCNGDVLFAFNLAKLLAMSGDDKSPVIVLRQVDDASRYGMVTLHGDRVIAFSERPNVGGDSLIDGGVYLLNRSVLDDLSPACSIEADVMPRLAARGVLRGVVGRGYFRDIGAPEDLVRAQQEIPGAMRRSGLFLDRDGVVNIDHGYVGTRNRFEWTPGAPEAIRAATDAGWHVFVVTNQSGVARGLYTEADVAALHAWMADEIRRIGGTIDDIRYCPFHPDGVVPEYRRESDWRKPAPGMLLDLLRAWELDVARCVLIGDQPRDMAAAAAAGIEAFRFQGGNLAEFVRPILEQGRGSACHC